MVDVSGGVYTVILSPELISTEDGGATELLQEYNTAAIPIKERHKIVLMPGIDLLIRN